MSRMLRLFLKRLLFVDDLTPNKLLPPTSDSAMVTSLLFRKNPGISRGAFYEFLVKEFVPSLWQQHQAWGVVSVQILSDASWGGVLLFPLRLLRTYRAVKLLCWICDKKPPQSYTTRFGSPYDVVIEIAFTGFPERETFDRILAMVYNANEIGECAVIASQLRRTFLAGQLDPEPGSKAIRLCFLVHRPRDMTRKECQTYWGIHHADLVLRNMKYIELARYFHILSIPEDKDLYDDTFDGIACAEKGSLLSLVCQLLKFNTFRFGNTLVLDELNFTVDTPVLLLR